MKEQDKIIKHISLIKFKDPRVIQSIVYHPFLFAKRRMADPDDYRPIRIRYFGAFVQKYMHNKEMFKKLSYMVTQLKLHPKLIKLFVDPISGSYFFSTESEAIKYVTKLFEDNEKEEFDKVYEAIFKAIENK